MHKQISLFCFLVALVVLVYPAYLQVSAQDSDSGSDLNLGDSGGYSDSEGSDGYLNSDGTSNVDQSNTAAQNQADAANPAEPEPYGAPLPGSEYVPPVTDSADYDPDRVTRTVRTTTNSGDSDSDDTNTNLQNITDVVDDISNDADQTEETIRTEFERTVIRTVQTLDNDEDRADVKKETDNIVDDLRRNIIDSSISTTKTTEELQRQIDVSLSDFERRIESRTGVDFDFGDEKNRIAEAIIQHKESVEAKKAVMSERGGDLLFTDSDDDGLSDYDELNIYKTDPNNAKTVDGDLTDGEKVLRGIDPVSLDSSSMDYKDPRDDITAVVVDSYAVKKMQVLKETKVMKDSGDESMPPEVVEEEVIVFEGTALPNSVITLYIYSTPIIVTVKADADGKWNYTLDQELEDGEHEMYVATVDNSGKIIARSNPIPFVKTAEAAVLGTDFPPLSLDQGPLFDRSFYVALILIVIGFGVIGLMFVGSTKPIEQKVSK